ncbi:MAG: hypothetical protein HYV26_19055 [Candidatus Hydrogenedentes bacterium]|nr:hypothetical protein [Candidatus Hydrogenedentota bacterium]
MVTRLNILALAVLLQGLCAGADEAGDLFERQIRPVLVEHCFPCHSHQSTELKGGLLLDSRDALLKGTA